MIEFTKEDVTVRRSMLVKELSEKICIIKFTKVDGTVREMPCTLDAAYLPPSIVKENHITKPFNPEVMSVWCTDKESWRSFRVQNVISIGYINA